MQMKNIIIAVAALAVGAAVGWFVGGVGERGMGNGERLAHRSLGEGGVTGNGEREGRASAAAKPKRKAPIRSSADAEVQERILRGRVATLEKRLAAAKKEAELVAKAKEAVNTSGKTLDWGALKKQREDAMMKLGKSDWKEISVGEIRSLAPDWWQRFNGAFNKGFDSNCGRQVDDIAEIVDSLDPSLMTAEQLASHEKFVNSIAGIRDKVALFCENLSDETRMDVVMGPRLQNGELQESSVCAQAEETTLNDIVKRAYGLSEEDAAAFKKVADELSDAVGNTLWGFVR